jgi:hypothetical protein
MQKFIKIEFARYFKNSFFCAFIFSIAFVFSLVIPSAKANESVVTIKQIGFKFEKPKFNISPDELPFAEKNGIADGKVYEDMEKVASEAFKTNGIELSVDAQVAYVLTARPITYKITTQMPYNQKFRSLIIKAELRRRLDGEVIWTEEKNVDIAPSVFTSRSRTSAGNWALNILNQLHAKRFVELPKGYAVSPNGSRNYLFD